MKKTPEQTGQPGIILFGLVLLLITVAGPAKATAFLISGKAMGTTYHITVATVGVERVDTLKNQIAARMEQLEQSMSTFRKDSEISRFNAFQKPGQLFSVSDDFYRVLKISKKLYGMTHGAWDGTIKPLVDLWGFGSTGKKKKIPDRRQIRRRLKQTGFHQIELKNDRHVVKLNASVILDLGSVAKGDAVDEISGLLRSKGINDYLVEIGGEVYASGTKKDGSPWRVGINKPLPHASFQQLHKVVKLKNKALATSGDYRNFFEVNGIRYSHVIDPKNGYPVSNGVVSVSVLADTCAFADGLATAVMVLGHKDGIALVNRIAGVECLIIVKQTDNTLIDVISNGFNAAISG
jgi:thiamine biosynthesis lipoprotein